MHVVDERLQNRYIHEKNGKGSASTPCQSGAKHPDRGLALITRAASAPRHKIPVGVQREKDLYEAGLAALMPK